MYYDLSLAKEYNETEKSKENKNLDGQNPKL